MLIFRVAIYKNIVIGLHYFSVSMLNNDIFYIKHHYYYYCPAFLSRAIVSIGAVALNTVLPATNTSAPASIIV